MGQFPVLSYQFLLFTSFLGNKRPHPKINTKFEIRSKFYPSTEISRQLSLIMKEIDFRVVHPLKTTITMTIPNTVTTTRCGGGEILPRTAVEENDCATDNKTLWYLLNRFDV